ncbi:MAG: hypothetical protein OSB09_08095 [Planctomycetota bacterium]|nr:hypothetical protein [Planctomycetota bacterium]
MTLPDGIETDPLLRRKWLAADREPLAVMLAEMLADPLYNPFLQGRSRR